MGGMSGTLVSGRLLLRTQHGLQFLLTLVTTQPEGKVPTTEHHPGCAAIHFPYQRDVTVIHGKYIKTHLSAKYNYSRLLQNVHSRLLLNAPIVWLESTVAP